MKPSMFDDRLTTQSQAYKDSKVCDVMLMKELHRRFHKDGRVFLSGLAVVSEENKRWYPLVNKHGDGKSLLS